MSMYTTLDVLPRLDFWNFLSFCILERYTQYPILEELFAKNINLNKLSLVLNTDVDHDVNVLLIK